MVGQITYCVCRDILDGYKKKITNLYWILNTNLFRRVWEHCPDDHKHIIKLVKEMRNEELKHYITHHKDLEDGEIQSIQILRERADMLGVSNSHKMGKVALRRALKDARERASTSKPCEATNKEGDNQ